MPAIRPLPRMSPTIGWRRSCSSWPKNAGSSSATPGTISSRTMASSVARADRAGHRVAAPGERVLVPAAAGSEDLDHALVHGDSGKGRVARGDPLREQHQVRDHVPVLDPEVPARPPDAGHDLVADEQHVVAVADLADGLVVARRGVTAGAAAPMIGSAMKAATVSGPSASMSAASARPEQSSQYGPFAASPCSQR